MAMTKPPTPGGLFAGVVAAGMVDGAGMVVMIGFVLATSGRVKIW